MQAKASPPLLRVALYARVSTPDKAQDPELQLAPLREYARARGWQATEYVDQATAGDLTGRRAWARRLVEVVDLPTVAALLGHSRLDTVRRYSQPDQAALERAVDALDECAPALQRSLAAASGSLAMGGGRIRAGPTD